jgi:hypothetical protein
VVPTVIPRGGGQVTFAANAQPVRLHELLRYDRWTLLLDAARADADTLHAVEDACTRSAAAIEIIAIATADPKTSRQLGRANEFKLVRPDGYVALIAPLDRLETLRDYLATLLHGGRDRSTEKDQSAGPEGAQRCDKRLFSDGSEAAGARFGRNN